MFVSHRDDRSNKVLTYAILDTQSSISFISTSVREKLQITGEETEFILSSMSAEEAVSQCQIMTGLVGRAYTDNIDVAIKEA